MKANNHIGIDQYGNIFTDLGKHPRKALMEQLGYKSASKMYIDTENGTEHHVGYVIGQHWINVYPVDSIA